MKVSLEEGLDKIQRAIITLDNKIKQQEKQIKMLVEITTKQANELIKLKNKTN